MLGTPLEHGSIRSVCGLFVVNWLLNFTLVPSLNSVRTCFLTQSHLNKSFRRVLCEICKIVHHPCHHARLCGTNSCLWLLVDGDYFLTESSCMGIHLHTQRFNPSHNCLDRTLGKHINFARCLSASSTFNDSLATSLAFYKVVVVVVVIERNPKFLLCLDYFTIFYTMLEC